MIFQPKTEKFDKLKAKVQYLVKREIGDPKKLHAILTKLESYSDIDADEEKYIKKCIFVLRKENTVIVKNLYEEILMREADSEGLVNYLDKMEDKNWDKEEIKKSLLLSKEYEENKDLIKYKRERKLKNEYKLPESEKINIKQKLDYLIKKEIGEPNKLKDTIKKIAEDSKITKEEDNYVEECLLIAKKNNTETITKLYNELLKRDPDREGLENYLNAIIEKELEFEDIKQDIINSKEFKKQIAN